MSEHEKHFREAVGLLATHHPDAYHLLDGHRPVAFDDCIIAIKTRLGIPIEEKVALAQSAAAAACFGLTNRWWWGVPFHQQPENVYLHLINVLEEKIDA